MGSLYSISQEKTNWIEDLEIVNLKTIPLGTLLSWTISPFPMQRILKLVESVLYILCHKCQTTGLHFLFYFQNSLALSHSYNPEKLVNASEGHKLHPSVSRENVLLQGMATYYVHRGIPEAETRVG